MESVSSKLVTATEEEADVINERPERRANRFFERAKQVVSMGSGSCIELERALNYSLKAISFHADHVPHYLFLAKLYKYALDITSAIFCYRFVLRIEPLNHNAKKYLSELLVIKGKELMNLAARSGSALKFRTARACFDESLEINREDPPVWILKAVCHIYCQELLEAYECINRVIRQGRGVTAETYILRAKVQWSRGLTEQGNADIKVAARLDPDHVEVIAYTARSYAKSEKLYKESVKEFTAGNYKVALQAVNHAIHITTEDVKLLILQSKIHRMLGDLQNAYDSMLRAKRLFDAAAEDSARPVTLPSDIIDQINLILNEMAINYAMKGDYSNAILLFNKIIKVEKATSKGGLLAMNHQYYKNRGDCYRALHQHYDAIYDYEKALKIKPTDWEVSTRLSLSHYLIATDLFNNESKYYDVISELDKAISYNPKVSEYYAIRGKAHYYVSNFPQAYADFKKTMQLDPTNDEIKERLSQFDDFTDPSSATSTNNNSSNISGSGTTAVVKTLIRQQQQQQQKFWRGAGVLPSGAPYLTIASSAAAAAAATDSATADFNLTAAVTNAAAAVLKKRVDFSQLPPTKHVEHVMTLLPQEDDVIDMMLRPKQAAKLPALKMLSKSADQCSTTLPLSLRRQQQQFASTAVAAASKTHERAKKSRAATTDFSEHLQEYDEYADLPAMQRSSAFKDAFKASVAVNSKRAAVVAIFDEKHDNTRGPLWEMIETAKTLAYKKSHPDRNKYHHPEDLKQQQPRQQQLQPPQQQKQPQRHHQKQSSPRRPSGSKPKQQSNSISNNNSSSNGRVSEQTATAATQKVAAATSESGRRIKSMRLHAKS